MQNIIFTMTESDNTSTLPDKVEKNDMVVNTTDEDDESDAEITSTANTPHSAVVRKQKLASKQLKKRLKFAEDNKVEEQVFLPEDSNWRIHDPYSEETVSRDKLDYRSQFSFSQLLYNCLILGSISMIKSTSTTLALTVKVTLSSSPSLMVLKMTRLE